MNARNIGLPFATRQLKIAGFCLIPALLNWYFIVTGTNPVSGRTSWRNEFAPIISVLALSVGLAVWLLVSVWRKRVAARRLGLRVQPVLAVKDCLGLVYLLPLWFRFQHHFSWTAPDGTLWKRVVFYGDAQLSLWLFICVFACLILVHARARLVAALKEHLLTSAPADAAITPRLSSGLVAGAPPSVLARLLPPKEAVFQIVLLSLLVGLCTLVATALALFVAGH